MKKKEQELIKRNVPLILIDLLKVVNGVDDYIEFFGISDISYCLFDSGKILNTDNIFIRNDLKEIYNFDHLCIDDKIDIFNPNLNWFKIGQDSFNNGGTSSIFIDMTPSNKGTIGQIVVFIHDPDTYKVIANSLDEFLQNIIDNDFKFLSY